MCMKCEAFYRKPHIVSKTHNVSPTGSTGLPSPHTCSPSPHPRAALPTRGAAPPALLVIARPDHEVSPHGRGHVESGHRLDVRDGGEGPRLGRVAVRRGRVGRKDKVSYDVLSN